MATRWVETEKNAPDELVAAGRRNLTLDEVRKLALRPLMRMIESMCDWGDGGAGQRVGESRFLIVDFHRSSQLGFYVQLYTEPADLVLAEAVSGALHKPIKAFMTAERRQALASLGYKTGGAAKNFQKEFNPKAPAAVRALADEVLALLFNVYGYRGRQPLRVFRHSDSWVRPASVFDHVTLDDVRKMAASAGVTVGPVDPKRIDPRDRKHALTHMLRVEQPFGFFLEMCAPDDRCKDWFQGVGFRAGFAGTAHVPDARIVEIAGSVPFVRLHRDAEGDVLVFWDMALKDTTEAYFKDALQTWFWLWMKVSTMLDGEPGTKRGRRRTPKAGDEDVPDFDLDLEPRAKAQKPLVH